MRRHRNAIQLERCEVCGRIEEQSSMFISDVQGLRGRLVCGRHRNEHLVATAPSWVDYRRDGGDVLPFDDVSREQPIGAGLEEWDVTEDV